MYVSVDVDWMWQALGNFVMNVFVHTLFAMLVHVALISIYCEVTLVVFDEGLSILFE